MTRIDQKILLELRRYNQINNYVQTCEIFGCSERSLKRWVDRFNETGNVDRKEREQGSYKLKGTY